MQWTRKIIIFWVVFWMSLQFSQWVHKENIILIILYIRIFYPYNGFIINIITFYHSNNLPFRILIAKLLKQVNCLSTICGAVRAPVDIWKYTEVACSMLLITMIQLPCDEWCKMTRALLSWWCWSPLPPPVVRQGWPGTLPATLSPVTCTYQSPTDIPVISCVISNTILCSWKIFLKQLYQRPSKDQ